MERGNSSEETEEETGEGVGLEPADDGSVEGEAGVSGSAGAEASAGAKDADGGTVTAEPGSDEWISDETIVDATKTVMGVVGGPAGIAVGEAAEWLGEQNKGSGDD